MHEAGVDAVGGVQRDLLSPHAGGFPRGPAKRDAVCLTRTSVCPTLEKACPTRFGGGVQHALGCVQHACGRV